MAEKVAKRLAKVIRHGYLQQGPVKNLTGYFVVPKLADIRLVYNGTACGLNEAL